MLYLVILKYEGLIMTTRLLVAGGAFTGAGFLGGIFFGLWGAIFFSIVGFLLSFKFLKNN